MTRRQTEWELVVCGLRGHVLFGADAEHARPQDALIARDYDGARWLRCLRCDSWIATTVPAAATSPYPPDRAQIEIPLRGKALRDKIVLRLIAIDRVVHFLILSLLGIAALVFAADRNSLRAAFYRVLTALQGGVAGGPVQTSGHVGIIGELDKLFSLSAGTVRVIGIALLAYGALEGIEAIGLWFTKRWAEYLTFIATTILLPLEIYEIVNRGTVLKVIGFLVNLAVVIYLLLAKRLFGLRGGGRTDERLRAYDTSWEAIEAASPPTRETSAAPTHSQ